MDIRLKFLRIALVGFCFFTSFALGAPEDKKGKDSAPESFNHAGLKATAGYTHVLSGREPKKLGEREKVQLEVALDFLSQKRTTLGLTSVDVNDMVVTDAVTTQHNGTTHFYFRQTHNGIEVWNSDINVHVNSDGKVFHHTNRFVADFAASVIAPAAGIGADEAIVAAVEHLKLNLSAPPTLVEDWGGAAQVASYSASEVSAQDIPVKLVYFPAENGQGAPVLAWNLVLDLKDGTAIWDMFVDASSGRVLKKVNWVTSCNFCGENTVAENGSPSSCGHASDSSKPGPDRWRKSAASQSAKPPSYQPVNTSSTTSLNGDQYRVFALPLAAPNDPASSNPNNDGRTIEVDPDDPSASPFGWLDDNGAVGNEYTDTRGNNVWAQEDQDDDNAGGARPVGGTNFDFDFPIDFTTAAPTAYIDSDTTNLFYWNNICHDIFWHHGFDEAAGNFQTNNYGNGGVGGDHVLADSLDGSGTNNANFATPPDGSNPRMQMYEFTSTTPTRSSSMDNLIIIHEYGHGVSNRLTGGPANSSCLTTSQASGMGEGWSDWLGVVMTAKATDTRATSRPVGTYVLGQNPITGAGIRPAPYNPDMSVNGLTYGSLNGGGLSIPHGFGTVWCTILWDIYWDLRDAHGYDPFLYNGGGGTNMALRLILDGMKLQPCDPSFVDARDAILAADMANNGGANNGLLWAAFARRGLGYSAIDGGGGSNVTEAFDLPDDLRIDSFDHLVSSGSSGGPFTPANKVYQLTNAGSAPVPWTATNSQPWVNVTPSSGTLAGGATVNVTVSYTASASSFPQGIYTDVVTFTNMANSASQTRDVILRIDVNDSTEHFTGTTDPFDLSNTQLTFSDLGGFFEVCTNPITSLPHGVASATAVTLSDDDSELITFTGGAVVNFYGVNYTSLHIGSNGYITFGSGDSDFSESLSDHFDLPRISGLFDDLNPTTGGQVYWEQLADRIVITYEQIREYSASTTNDFQIEVFFAGDVRISYLNIAANDGVVGLSDGGGLSVSFVEADFSSSTVCVQEVVVAAVDLEATEYNLSNTASVTVTRSNPTIAPLDVFFLVSGSATLASDYSLDVLGAFLTIPAGSNSVTVTLTPIADVAAEGSETVDFALAANAAYTLGANDSETMVIKDLLIDAWRFLHFGAGNPAGSGDTDDPDNDGYANLMEYGLGIDPNVHDNCPIGPTVETTGAVDYLNLVYPLDTSLTDITYEVETSATLATGSWVTTGILDTLDSTTGTIETHKAQIVRTGNKGFLRLKITRNP